MEYKIPKMFEEYNKYDDPNIEKHKIICDDLHLLYKQKNADYGNAFHKSYEEYGMIMPLIRLEDKLNRLKSLTKNGVQNVIDESMTDTLMDIAGYALLSILELNK